MTPCSWHTDEVRHEHDEQLLEALGASQRLGFLGDRSIDEVIAHARYFVDALVDVTGSIADIGAGGGVPGLVVAMDRPDLHITMVDRRTKRTTFCRVWSGASVLPIVLPCWGWTSSRPSNSDTMDSTQ